MDPDVMGIITAATSRKVCIIVEIIVCLTKPMIGETLH